MTLQVKWAIEAEIFYVANTNQILAKEYVYIYIYIYIKQGCCVIRSGKL